ncbi:Na+/H+ antiporter subunit G [Pseudooceanicola sediminis]|uniref:Na+/H+ antiporter subunit G n=1 Tax=Pseudooceanicola sediminis TaxID=2211117 RepID=A0A399J2G5_9RHOB|nr:Na+/H+ antiporter subunit G [Pseudooceanicola sediminis]KAA2317269.1 Na+/H+ antiporter subunit G [Puniceibacterium sp. HSS470]RII39623.1 Na+/H+ antiporter subunit G [Pseudooceanicola sediminis]|tara:strand:- start:22447 stop:22809 length:363 start_codon:yes stop_codon:yes gene_type:complete
MNMLAEILVTAMIVIGALFTLIGSFGLLKLNLPMSRLHAPTKAGTLGVGGILLASMLYSFADGPGSLHELLIAAFLFVTAPVSAYFIAKVHIHRGQLGQDLPPPPEDSIWATREKPLPEE